MTLLIEKEAPPLDVRADGTVRVGGTRVTLDTLVATYQQGATAEEIVHRYPTLSLAAVYAAIGYYLNHTAEVEAYLVGRRKQAAAIRREVEAKYDRQEIRQRLLARRAAQG